MNPSIAVVGGGHNALVAACYLARAGCSVTIFERSDVIGGATNTSEIAPGYKISAASYSLGLLRPAIVRELGLHLVLKRKNPSAFVPLRSDHLFVWPDEQRTLAEFERIGEQGDYAGFCNLMDEAAKVFRPMLDDPSPPTPAELEASLDPEFYRLCVAGSAAETCSKYFTHDLTRGLFASQGIVGTAASVDEDGTAWVMTYHNIAGELVDSVGAWCYVRGGMGAIATELMRLATELGVTIKTSSSVVGLVVKNDSAAGIVLADGTEFVADLVLSGADADTTYRIANIDRPTLETHGAVVKVNLALASVPEFACLPGVGPQQTGTVTFNTSLTDLRNSFDQAEHAVSPKPWIEMFITSARDDPTLVEHGAVASAFCQYAPHDGKFDRGDASLKIFSNILKHAPEVDVVAMEVLGPPQLSERFGLPNGDIFHGDLRPPQMLGGRLSYETPLEGLWMCGSSTHPGGAVTGACGRNAAKRIIAALQE